MNLRKRLISMLLLAVFFATTLIPIVANATEKVSSYTSKISSPDSVSGSWFTGSSLLAEKLDALFRGEAKIFYKTSNLNGTAYGYSLGSTQLNGSNQFWVAPKDRRTYSSGWQCFIYGGGAYCYLFDDLPHQSNTWHVSKTVVSGRSFSNGNAIYQAFSSAGVRVGAYIRTTANSDYSYSGKYGHSMIVLAYDSTYIWTLCANGDGNGTVLVYKYTWEEFYYTRFQKQGRYLHIVVQPKDEFYNELYPEDGSTPVGTSWIHQYNPTVDSSVTPEAIQKVFEHYGSSLANYTMVNGQMKVVVNGQYLDLGFDNYFSYSNTLTEPHLSNKSIAVTLSPAEILYYACIENSCNVAFMFGKLQQEQSLMTNQATQSKLNCAVGYLSNNGTGQKNNGFFGQIIACTWQQYNYYERGYSMQQAYETYTPPSVSGNMSYDTFLTLYNRYASTLSEYMISNSPITAPIIYSPIDEYYSDTAGQHYKANESITFSWSSVPGAVKYWYAVKVLAGYPNPSDNETPYDSIYNEQDNVLSVPIPANRVVEGKWIKCAVGAISADGHQAWAQYTYIYIPSSLQAPTITSPVDEYYADGGSNAGNRYKAGKSITFSWSPISGAASYEYKVKRLNGEPDPYGNNESDEPGTPINSVYFTQNSSTSYTVDGSQFEGGIWYKFAVASVTSEGVKAWGQYSYIKIGEIASQQVEQPVITSTSITGGATVSISCGTSGATIYYTKDGSTPNTNSTRYTSPFTVYSSCTIRAIAVKSGMTDSAVATKTVTISQQTVATPEFNVANTTGGKLINIYCSTEGASIQYKIDSASWIQYSNPFIVSQSCTIQAKATKSGMTDSPIQSVYVDIPVTVTHTVTFKDGVTGGTISTTSVNHGNNVSFPTPPTHTGYIFVRWDHDGKNITSDITITAVYERTEVPANAPQFIVSSVQGKVGDTITITVSAKNNPGFTTADLYFSYNTSVLELTAAPQSGSLTSGSQIITSPSLTAMPYHTVIVNGLSDITGDGIALTLTFRIKDNAPEGTYSIDLTVGREDTCNVAGDYIDFAPISGSVNVIKYILGDANGDGKINTRDAVLILQYFAGWDIQIDMKASDVNGDGKVNTRDAVLILQYFAGWTNTPLS